MRLSNTPIFVTDLPVELEDYATAPISFTKIGSDVFRIEVLYIARGPTGDPFRTEFQVTNTASGRKVTFDVMKSDGTNLSIDHLVTGYDGISEKATQTNSLKYFIANELELPYSSGFPALADPLESSFLSFLSPRTYPKPDEGHVMKKHYEFY